MYNNFFPKTSAHVPTNIDQLIVHNKKIINRKNKSSITAKLLEHCLLDRMCATFFQQYIPCSIYYMLDKTVLTYLY
jgi:hypothetical protein